MIFYAWKRIRFLPSQTVALTEFHETSLREKKDKLTNEQKK